MASPLRRASRVTYRPTAWLLEDYIPLGALTMLDGDPGVSKSTLMVNLAARVSTGRPMPLNLGSSLTKPARVFIYQAEDSDSRVAAMLVAAGADMDKVRVACSDANGPPLTLPDDMPRLTRLARKGQPKLIVIDPMTGFIRGGVNNDVPLRKALGPLNKLAAEISAAVVLVRHLSKGRSSDPRRAGVGSIASTGLARSVLLLAPDPADEKNCALAVSKTNLTGIPNDALLFRPIDRGDCATLHWLGQVPLRARELLGGADDDGALSQAKGFLRQFLSQGEREVNEALAAAVGAGIAPRTLTRARRRLRITVRHEGFAEQSRYFLVLPPDPYGAIFAQEAARALQHQQAIDFARQLSARPMRRVDRKKTPPA